jgi:predicted transposase YbfD/YdcC
MIFIALCAAIGGANSWVDVERFGNAKRDWFKKFLKLENGIPSHDTFGRVFARLDTAEFYLAVHNWLRNLRFTIKDEHVAIDGKTLRGSRNSVPGKAALQLVNAWASGLRLCLGQVAVDDESNEIPAARQLLEMLELTGAVVTLDAIHCQKETAATICARQADYVLIVKDNQPTLHNELLELFGQYGEQDFRAAGLRCHKTQETSHGRIERRIYYVIAAPWEWVQRGDWPGLRSVGMVYRSREEGGVVQTQVTFFISSLPPKVRRIADLVRKHWSIETSLHWVLDVIFAEDGSRIRKGVGQEIAGVFRRLALSILQQDTSLKENIRGKRLRAGWHDETLEGILESVCLI